ncbi:MAG TPA: hypothetical protein VK206_15935 [Anaerolineales bacterium]|nr:hypothetical protein [Anaerolineales bacterium]
MKTTKLFRFFKKNWYNTVSLFLSLVAVFIALQANNYARQNSTPNLVVKDIGELNGRGKETSWILNIDGCYHKSRNTYELELVTGNEYWISNSGGLDSALVSLDFKSRLDEDLKNRFEYLWYAHMYKHPNPDLIGDIMYQLDIPSASTVPLNVHAGIGQEFPTKEMLLSFLNSLPVINSGNGEYKIDGHWYFRFGNGITLIHSYDTMRVSMWADLADRLESPCNPHRL